MGDKTKIEFKIRTIYYDTMINYWLFKKFKPLGLVWIEERERGGAKSNFRSIQLYFLSLSLNPNGPLKNDK